MFGFFKKYRLVFYILSAIAFGFFTYENFNDYFTKEYDEIKDKKMDLISGIALGILTIYYLVEVIDYLLNKRKLAKEAGKVGNAE
jgi:hypothetical protein